ncbi:PAS domain-containing protein [Marinomonas colpomeniae]|uniref:histidine kinase n=1 Tax=Marinomonas colpomeniae TaxID=2774408 RepID=A0ABR8P2P0_9GAMM|nr:PAS domain-containing protein [Marinomonas colpomeniae]MBD5772553.1 PAS domain-containing protein [Marinomonas colpomeniae]
MALLKTLSLQKIMNRVFASSSNKPTEGLLDSLQEIVLVLNQCGAIQYVNQCWIQLSGLPTQKSLGQSIESFLHPEDIPSWSRAFQSLPTVKQQRIWCRLLSKTGDIHWCEVRMQMMSNYPFTVSATLSDITSHVRDENVRQADYRSLDAMVNRLPAIVYRARNNKNWSMEYVSDGCFELTGYPAEELVNHTQLSFASLIHPEDNTEVWESVQQALEEKSVFDLDYRLIHANGSVMSVTEKGQGLYSSTGSILGVEGIIFRKK